MKIRNHVYCCVIDQSKYDDEETLLEDIRKGVESEINEELEHHPTWKLVCTTILDKTPSEIRFFITYGIEDGANQISACPNCDHVFYVDNE